MKKLLILLCLTGVVILFFAYYYRDTTSTLFSFSCGNGASLLFKEKIIRKFDIENARENFSSYLAYEDSVGERVVDSYQGDHVFPAHLGVRDYKKFSAIDNERYLTAEFERTDWNIWVSDKTFSENEYRSMQKCLEENIDSFDKRLALLPYPLRITSISFVPLEQSLSGDYYGSWEDGTVANFSCPTTEGTRSSTVTVDKQRGQVISSAAYRIGFINAGGSFQRFSKEGTDTPSNVGTYINILPTCRNSGGKNIYEYFSEKYP